jgi:F-type H+-transporting ATPase subunit a
VQNLITPASKNYFKILLLLNVKFPLLYLIGYGLLATNLPALSLLVGFSLILSVIFFNGFKSALLNKSFLCLLALLVTATLSASIDSEVPEVPNIFTLLHKNFKDSPWAIFLHHWQTLVFSIFIGTVISLLFHLGARKITLVPSRFQNFLEWIVESLRHFILEVLGPEGEKFVPFLGTLFIYILTMNWLVLIPFMKAPSSNFNITVALAICVFCLVQYLNIKNFGVKGFLYHMAGSPKTALEWALVPLMFFVELLTQFSRPITLSLRLFGNVVGEDILIGAFALFGVLLLSHYNAPIGLPLQIPFMFLSLLTGLMQALVFTLLSTIYILLSVPHSKDHDHPGSEEKSAD